MTLSSNNQKLEKAFDEVKNEYDSLNKRYLELPSILEEKSEKLKETIEENNK